MSIGSAKVKMTFPSRPAVRLRIGGHYSPGEPELDSPGPLPYNPAMRIDASFAPRGGLPSFTETIIPVDGGAVVPRS